MPRGLSIASLLLCCACQGSSASGTCVTGSSEPASGVPERLFIEPGSQVTLPFQVFAGSGSCDGTAASDVSVNAEVLNPLNLPIEHQTTRVTVTQMMLSTSVTFTPDIPGPYHVKLSFEPSLATLQQTFHVIRKRSDSLQFQGAQHECNDVERANDVLVCLDDTGLLHELSNGHLVPSRPSAGVARGLPGLWSWSGSGVQLLQSDGGHLIDSEVFDAGVTIVAAAAVKDTPRLLALGRQRLQTITATPEGFTMSSRNVLGDPAARGAAAAAINPDELAYPCSAGSLVPTTICIATGLQHSVREWLMPRTPLRVEGDAVWQQGSDGTTVARTTFAMRGSEFGNSTQEFQSLLAGFPNQSNGVYSIPFSVKDSQVLLFSPRTGEYHQYAVSPQARANSHYVWERVGTTLTVFER